ncbi:hypothetical protein [Roseateles sp.]|uniref:SNARE domain-containing protein n=1 Tax=Roseateles sp. TaxID=1971397 RepID=UPI002F3E891C
MPFLDPPHSQSYRRSRNKVNKQTALARASDRQGFHLNIYLVERITALSDDVTGLKVESRAMNGRIDQLDERIDRLEVRIDKFESKVDKGFEETNKKLDTLLHKGSYHKGAAWAVGLILAGIGPCIAWVGSNMVARINLAPAPVVASAVQTPASSP